MKRGIGRGARRLPPWSSYIAALLAVAGAVTAWVLLAGVLDEGALPLLFVPAVLAASTLGGLGPGLVATALSVVASVLIGAEVPPSRAALARYILFVIVCVALSARGEWLAAHRRRAERSAEEVREREAHLASILATVPDAMIVIDEKGVIQSFSAAAAEMFGWSRAEAVGRNVSLLMPSPYREDHDHYLRRYLTSGEAHIIGIGREIVGQRRDGSNFPMHLSVGEVRLEDRRHFTGFVRDLSATKQAETRLQELRSELIHVSRVSAMGEMASALAHELNQPLSAVANYLSGSRRLLDKGDLADRERLGDALEKAAGQAMRAGDVIRRLRDFLGRGEIERRIESLSRLIEEAGALALVGAKEQGVRVTMRFDPECDAVLADRVQVQQVMVNLIRNGLDAMRDTERRELRIESAPHADGFTIVTVSDTGAGLSEEVRGRLFTPFTTTKASGMGVGLSICRTIVEAHGGAIWAEPGPDGGASFAFTLPVATRDVTE